MKCGHIAQGVDAETRQPVCVICIGIDTGYNQPAKPISLESRESRCMSCHKVEPSSFNLAFFEYSGPDSPSAIDICKCGRAYRAHTAETLGRVPITGHAFEARGPLEFDGHYDGCKGWD